MKHCYIINESGRILTEEAIMYIGNKIYDDSFFSQKVQFEMGEEWLDRKILVRNIRKHPGKTVLISGNDVKVINKIPEDILIVLNSEDFPELNAYEMINKLYK